MLKFLTLDWDWLKGYRTMFWNIILGIPPLLLTILEIANLAEFKAIIPPKYMPIYVLVLVVVNMRMRKLTTGPLGRGT